MDYIKPNKVVFTRIGDQESWAGWNIAGYTKQTPNDILVSCRRHQARNAEKARFMFAKCQDDPDAGEVYEYVCVPCGSDGNICSFSRLSFGDSDLGGRASMNAASVCLPASESAAVLRAPQTLLTVDRSCFDECELDSGLLERAAGKNNYSADDLQTVFEPEKYACESKFDVEEAVDEVFSDRKIYRDFIKCVYWSLTFNSATSVFVKTDGGLDDKIKIFLIAMNSLIYSFRPKLSFRTFNFEDATNRVSIVFCDSIPYGERFFDLKTGKNNILSDSVIKKLRKQSLEYYPENLGSAGAEKYFDRVERTLEEFGSKGSTDMLQLETAFAFAQSDSDGESFGSDRELIKKLINFCNLPYGNDKIDSYIAGLLDTVLTEGIALNDDIKGHVDRKLRTTKCEELTDIGNRYRAVNLLAEPRAQAFVRLEAIRASDKNFGRILDYLLLEPEGAGFVDDFYGTYFGPKNIHSGTALLSFIEEVRGISQRTEIDLFIKEVCFKWGEKKLDKFFDGGAPLDEAMRSFEKTLGEIYPNNSTAVSGIMRGLRYRFWNRFSFTQFGYEHLETYRAMRFSDMSSFPNETVKCGFVSKIAEISETAKKGNPNTVRSFKNKLDETTVLDDASRANLIKQFRRFCLENCEKSKNLDFWLALAELEPSTGGSFLFGTGLGVISDPVVFERELRNSEELKKPEKLDCFRTELERMREYGDSRELAQISEIFRRFDKARRRVKGNEKPAARDRDGSKRSGGNGAKRADKDGFSATPSDSSRDISSRSEKSGRDISSRSAPSTYKERMKLSKSEYVDKSSFDKSDAVNDSSRDISSNSGDRRGKGSQAQQPEEKTSLFNKMKKIIKR